MIFEKSLFAFLSGDTALGALIEGRVFGLIQSPDSAQPSIIYARRGTSRTQTHCATDSKVRVTISIDCYDKSYLGVKELADVVRRTLSDFTGDMYGTQVSSVSMDSEEDVPVPEPGLFGVSQVYSIWFLEE